MGERRRRRLATLVLTLSIVAGLAGGCQRGRGGAAPATTSPGGIDPSSGALARPEIGQPGPFEVLRWSGRPIPAGRLLHDDGRRLWSIGLGGDRHVIWRHPPATVGALAVSASRRRLALSVTLSEERRLRADDESAALLLLERNGEIRTVDVVDGFRAIEAPAFLRSASERGGPERLYWIRFSDEIDAETGRLATQVMVLDGDAIHRVAIPLRFAEAVVDLHGYPGTPTHSLTLFRQNDVPTRYEILRNDDGAGATAAALTLWGVNEARAQTDTGVGVAWVSPSDYVVPVVHEFFPGGYELRRFRVGCEALGSQVVFAGRGIDRGYAETPWRLLPAGPERVLVLTSEEVSDVARGQRTFARWHALGLTDGVLRATPVRWRPSEGGWTWVPRPGIRPSRGCEAPRWRYP